MSVAAEELNAQGQAGDPVGATPVDDLDGLDGVDPAALDGDGATPEGDGGETYTLDDGTEVSVSELVKAHGDKEKWVKNNTQKSMEIAEEKKKVDMQAAVLEEREKRLKVMEDNAYRTQEATYPPEQPAGDVDFDFDEYDDPGVKKLAETVQNMNKTLRTNQENAEKQAFIMANKVSHQEQQATHGENYRPQEIESRILSGSNRYDDVFKAMQYEKIMAGDPSTIKSLIPESVLKEIQADNRKAVIADIKKRNDLKKSAAIPRQKTRGIVKTVKTGDKPKNYNEVSANAIKSLEGSDVSLFK